MHQSTQSKMSPRQSKQRKDKGKKSPRKIQQRKASLQSFKNKYFNTQQDFIMPLTGNGPFMRRYKATLVNGHEFYVMANEHHQAAQDAEDKAKKLGAELQDVGVMND